MSINNITAYDDLYSATTSIEVGGVVFTGDLNIEMSRAAPGNPALPAIGSVLQLNGFNLVEWKPLQSIQDASIAFTTFTIPETTIDTYPVTEPVADAGFKTLVLEQLSANVLPFILDPVGGLSFMIPYTVRGVFLVFVNYPVRVPGNNVCYEFKTETLVSPLDNFPVVGFNENSRLGLLSTTVFNGLADKFFTFPYTYSTSFVIDSYTPPGNNNTYVRFRCRKQAESMDDGAVANTLDTNYSSISIMRIS